MPYTTFAAGAVLTAAQLNTNVRDQVVVPFTTTTARDTAITVPVEGMVCVVTGEDRLYVYDGAAWQRCGQYSQAGRTGASVSRSAAQSITSSTMTTITFDTVTYDSDSFHSGSTFSLVTIPTGLGGLYEISGYVVWGTTTATCSIALSFSGSDHIVFDGAGAISATVWDYCAIQQVAAASTVALRVYQFTGGGSVNATGQMYITRLLI